MYSTSISLKTTFERWHRLLFILPSLSLTLIFFLLLNYGLLTRNIAPFLIIFLVGGGVGFYFLANYFTKSDTKISFNGTLLTIEQTNNKLGKNSFRQFETNAIRGFEINQVKNDDTLIIYLNDNSYYRYPIFSISSALELDAFLATKITKLTVKDNPNFPSFWRAFLFALSHIVASWAVMASMVYGIVRLAKTYSWEYSLHKFPLVVLFSTMCMLSWFLLVYLPVKNKKFRYLAFTIKNFLFLGFSFGLIIPAMVAKEKLNDKGITITSAFDMLNYPKDKLFFIKNASLSPQGNLFSDTKISKGHKSNKFKVEHIFVSQIISPTQNESIQVINFWISKSYVQRIPLAIPKEEKDSLIKKSWQESRAKLIGDLQEKPRFYTVLYNSLTSAQKFSAAYILIKSNQLDNSATIILEPHWEFFDSYKRELKTQLYLIYLGIAVLNIIAAIIIAVNR